jgi:hypothetical protein
MSHPFGQAVMRRVQRELGIVDPWLLCRPLPPPAAVLALPLSHRTALILRRVADAGVDDGQWTVGRYLTIRRFGVAAMVDLLARIDEAARRRGEEGPLRAAVSVDRAMEVLQSRLPISDEQARAAIGREGEKGAAVDLSQLAHAAARAGRNLPYRVLDLAGTRIAVAQHQAHAASVAYAIASRNVYNWGAASVRGVTEQLCVVLSTLFAVTFVERLLGAISSVEWLDGNGDWFWFKGRSSRLLLSLRNVLSVVTALPLARLSRIARRAWGDREPPPDQVLGQICATLPGTRVAGDIVLVEKAVPAGPGLGAAEMWLVQVLRGARAPLPATEIERLGVAAGFRLPALRRILGASLLVEPLPGDTFALVGT